MRRLKFTSIGKEIVMSTWARLGCAGSGKAAWMEALEGRVLLAADPVLAWNDMTLQTEAAFGPGGPPGTRVLAMVHAATRAYGSCPCG